LNPDAPNHRFLQQSAFPLIYLFIGLACYLVGFTVFLLRWEDPKARLLYWLPWSSPTP